MDKRHSKYSFIQSALSQRREEHRFRELTPILPELESSTIIKDGKKLINFCSNDYLGLSRHPKVIERSKEFADKYGAGATASRLISGTFDIHTQLEGKLAQAFGFESSLIYNSGFQANTSIISAVADRNSLILIDKKCHNSLIQGAILSRAAIQRFNHNDSDHLRSLIKKAVSKSYNRILIVTETVFSMDGDLNKLDELISIAAENNALLYSDDAHALGILGDQGLGLNSGKTGIDLNLGTFGKSFGGFGAFVGCSREMKDFLINFSPGFIYTTALPPSVVGGIDAALDLIPGMESERKQLFSLIDYFKSEIAGLGFDTMNSDSQIIPVLIGKEKDTITLSNYLEDKGLWVSAVRPPTVENDASRLRITLTAKHTEEQVRTLIQALGDWKRG